ncbi:MAG: LacI family DNA-binding transcriptional regulator [Atopobiaceae bacterium]|nr:LacI family DNA-binding transcriptional regulator [Atopobiaceae bacterium]
MPKRTVSIYDIAKLAGVSAATVSNVLNDKGGFSKATKERILAIAHEQGYVANFAAKSLRESSTKTIALLTPDVSNDFFSNLVLAVEGRLRTAGYASYICNTASDPERESHYVRDLVAKQVDGIVYIGGATRSPIDVTFDLPVIHIDHTGSLGTKREAHVSNDFTSLTNDMTETLVSHGCRNIALVSVSATVYQSEDRSLYAGYSQCLARHGISFDEDLMLEGPHKQASIDEAAELVGGLLDTGRPFDGVVALGDRVALGVVNTLKRRGVNVGHDVRVIGMDDSIYSRISTPAISTVNRHTDEMAAHGVNALLSLIAGEELAEYHIIVPHEVVERATTLGIGG